MGKYNQKACPYTEKEREQSFSSDPKRKGERSKAGHCPFQIDGTAPVNFFFFHFSDLGMKCYF